MTRNRITKVLKRLVIESPNNVRADMVVNYPMIEV
jgi:hypothetical protein